MLHRPWALSIADFTYFHAHFVITTLFMFWLYLRRNRHYYFIRNTIFAADAIALVGFTFFPTAPPRLLTYLGFIDTLERFAASTTYSGPIKDLANPYAAVPSIHTCFSLITAVACFFLVRACPCASPGCSIRSDRVLDRGHRQPLLDGRVLGATTAVIAFGGGLAAGAARPTLPESARVHMTWRPRCSSDPSPP